MSNKNDSVAIYTNNEAVSYEMALLERVLAQTIEVKNYLETEGVECSALTIEQACRGKFDKIKQNYIDAETDKLNAFEQQFGVLSLVSDNAAIKLQSKAEQLADNLFAGMPKLEYLSRYVIDYIDFETMQVQTEYNKKFFETKHSVFVDADTAKHQKNLVNALNYFMSENRELFPNTILQRLAHFNTTERMYSPKFDLFDAKNVRGWVDAIVNEQDWSKRLR